MIAPEFLKWLPVAVTLTGVGAGWATMKAEISNVQQIRSQDMARVVKVEDGARKLELEVARDVERLDAVMRSQEKIEKKLDQVLESLRRR